MAETPAGTFLPLGQVTITNLKKLCREEGLTCMDLDTLIDNSNFY